MSYSDKSYNKEKAKKPGYDAARALSMEFLKKLREMGWEIHTAYSKDDHFFLEETPK